MQLDMATLTPFVRSRYLSTSAYISVMSSQCLGFDGCDPSWPSYLALNDAVDIEGAYWIVLVNIDVRTMYVHPRQILCGSRFTLRRLSYKGTVNT